MNLYEQFGVKEVADVCLYSIELDENDNEVYIPVLYMDTLKVSTVEESTSQTSANGGQGNPKLMAWDYGKDITVTLEDALFTPASNSMNWGAKLGAKGLQLYLRYFFDRNTDDNVPDTCLRTATLNAEKISDFLIIPDRWPEYETEEYNRQDKKAVGYVGGTSIYCWMIDGFIISHDGDKRVAFKDLILFYREQTQKWYFFNGQGPTNDESTWYKTPYRHYEGHESYTYDDEYFAIHYQYGREVFDWIRQHIAIPDKNYVPTGEYEPVANVTLAAWGKKRYLMEDDDPNVFFLTQNLYIDGFRNGCAKDKKYSDLTDNEINGINANEYLPYRFFANVGVEYNTNVKPPQETIYSIDTAWKDVFLHEHMEKVKATRTFCIDTDVNTRHDQYRQIDKYSQTPLTVFYNPKTMKPYMPNSFEFYTSTGKRITGNLRIIKKGEIYYKWIRQKARENRAIAQQLIIDPVHFPGVYRLVGRTEIRDRYGKDIKYQFEIPLCKLTPDNKLTLQAAGEPTVFTMKLSALRREDGVMMKLTAYDLIEPNCPCEIKKGEMEDFNSPYVAVSPEAFEGDFEPDLEIEALANDRDIAPALIENTDNNIIHGFVKTTVLANDSHVSARINGGIKVYSIDGTQLGRRRLDDYLLSPDEYEATIKGSDTR